MQRSGLGLAVVASASLMLLSTPAFAEGMGPSAVAGPTKATPAPKAKPATGWIILGIGGAATVGGIALEIVGATYSKAVPGAGGPGAGQTTTSARTNFLFGGTALLIAGLVTGVVGGSMILHRSEDTNKKPADDASTDPMAHAVAAALQAAPAAMVPIVAGTF